MENEIKKDVEKVEQERKELLEEQSKKIPPEQIEDELREIEKDKEGGNNLEKNNELIDEGKPKRGDERANVPEGGGGDAVDENKEEKPKIIPKNKKANAPVNSGIFKNKNAKEGSFKPLIFVMLASLIIAFYWDKLPWISNSVHFILNPTAGSLLNWNLNLGMLIIVAVITLITTLVQKYATDQDTLKELKKEQKEIQKQMKEFKHHPEKMMELQKKQFAMMPKQMKLSMRGIAYTGIPFILFFRWFNDYFAAAGNPRFLFGMSWFLFYLICAIIISSILRKQMNVV